MTDVSVESHIQLNTRGLYCPDPIMKLRQVIRKIQSGEVVEVFATDISTSWDIPRFCVHMNHELVLKEEYLDDKGHKEYRYLIKKG